MEVSNMKNMVVLKNLPSNIVEEAFVVLIAIAVEKYAYFSTAIAIIEGLILLCI